MKSIYCAALAAVLAGCAASGTQVSQQSALQFKEHVTTEAQIVAALGPPTGVTVANGTKFLSYSGAQMRVKPATFIPIVGAFAGGADYRMTMAMYQIGPDGVLEKVTYSSSGAGSQAGTNPAEMPSQAPASK